MNLRTMQARKESADDSKWEAIFAEDAWQAALESEAEAIASRKLQGSAIYALKVLERDDLELDTVIDADRKIDWQTLMYRRMFGSMSQADFIETLAKWLAQNDDDIQREARGNIEGDAFDNYHDDDFDRAYSVEWGE